MKFSIKGFYSKCDQIRWKLRKLEIGNLVIFAEKILNGKRDFLCSEGVNITTYEIKGFFWLSIFTVILL